VSGRSRRGAAPWTRAVGAALALAVLAPALGCAGDDRGDGGRTPDPEPDGPTSPYAPSWAAVHADAANTDYSPVDPGADVALAWDEHIDGSLRIGPLPWTINLGPTLDPDGNLYLTSSQRGCHLRSLDGATGELRWCAADIDLLAVSSSPLIDRDGVLYVADGLGLHALDPGGSERWLVPLDGVPLSVQFTSQGHLAFVTHTGTAYVLDRRDGRSLVDPVDLAPGVEWRPEDGMMACARGTEACPSANTLAVDLATDRLVFTLWAPGAAQAGVRAVRYREDPEPALVPEWENDALPGGTASSPVLSADGSRVYVTDNQGSLHAVDAATGASVWDVGIGGASGGSPSLSPEGLIMPAGGNGIPVVAVRDEGARAEVVWRRDDLANRGIATQTAGERVFATVQAGGPGLELVVLDARDGHELDREPIPGSGVFSVGTTVGPDGTVFVPTVVGGLAAFRAAPG
jgi:outer membrane protein assembly factor BamB